jgi:hypothetical protein
MGKKQPTELQRTCGRCGHVWYVQADAKEIKQAVGTGWATPLFGKKRNELRAQRAQIELANAKVAEAGRCSGCGSSSFSETEVPV